MKTFKNINADFENRKEGTQILFAQSETKPEGNWIDQKEDEFEIEIEYVYDAKSLYVQDGVRYFGWL